jgi:hypothetical protein
MVLAATALTVVAAFLPWESGAGLPVPGIRGDGLGTLVLAIAGGALILTDRAGKAVTTIVEAALGALVVVIALYHVDDPLGAFGIYVTLAAGLLWVGALGWLWFERRGKAPSPG